MQVVLLLILGPKSAGTANSGPRWARLRPARLLKKSQFVAKYYPNKYCCSLDPIPLSRKRAAALLTLGRPCGLRCNPIFAANDDRDLRGQSPNRSCKKTSADPYIRSRPQFSLLPDWPPCNLRTNVSPNRQPARQPAKPASL